MDIQAALRDGYSKEDVMAELGKRTGMNYQQALQDGHDPDSVMEEMSNRTKGVSKATPAPIEPGFLSNVGTALSKRYENLKNLPNEIPDAGFNPRFPVRAMGEIAGAGVDVLNEGIKSLYKTVVPDETQATVAQEAKGFIAPQEGKRDLVADLSKIPGTLESFYPGASKDAEAAVNLSMVGPMLAGAKGAAIMGQKALPYGKLAAESVSGAAKRAGSATLNFINPRPTPEQAMGQLLQSKGKTPGLIAKDLAKGKDALAVIGIDDLLTTPKGKIRYSDISGKIDETIPAYAAKVDAELMKDANVYRLNDLSTVQKTKGGATVKSNYVKDAIDHLDELYTKTGDPVKAGEIQELLSRAKTQGLTKKEVNDIARVYGSEFKSFNPTIGTPLTSINAQTYENVRQGLKEVARRGLSDTAKELDSTMSSLYNTKRLIDQNASAANKLRQKIDERGLGQKIGRFVWDAVDAATLGIAKGALLKMIPRGMGYKVKNFIDLEESLTRNLKIINTELKRVERLQPTAKAGTLVESTPQTAELGRLETNPINVPETGKLVQPTLNPQVAPLTNEINRLESWLTKNEAYRGTPQHDAMSNALQESRGKLAGITGERIAPPETTKVSPPVEIVQRGATSGEYQGKHRPMTVEGGAGRLHDLEPTFGPDIYGPDAIQYFGTGEKVLDIQTLRILKAVRGKPEADVTIYRAIPKGENASSAAPGDWVTVNKRYAQEHGEGILGGDYKIIEQKVKARDLTTNADSFNEQGYYPEIPAPLPEAKSIPARIEALEKKKGIAKGPEGIIGRLIREGGIKDDASYNSKLLRESPDGKRVMGKNGKYTFDEWADILTDEGYLGVETGDKLRQAIGSGEARKIYSPEKIDDLMERDIRRIEDEHYKNLDPDAIRASEENLKETIIRELREEAKLTAAEEAAALREVEDFFSSIPKGKATPKLEESKPRRRKGEEPF